MSPQFVVSESKRAKSAMEPTTNCKSNDDSSLDFTANFLSSIMDPSVRSSLVILITDCMLPLKLEIAQLRSVNNWYKDETKTLNLDLTAARNDLSMANKAYEHVCQELADLQQYTKCNALRIMNPSWPELPDENTDVLVIQLAAQLGLTIEPWEIFQFHRVGKPQLGKIRPVLVKFIGYRTIESLYKARKDLEKTMPA